MDNQEFVLQEAARRLTRDFGYNRRVVLLKDGTPQQIGRFVGFHPEGGEIVGHVKLADGKTVTVCDKSEWRRFDPVADRWLERETP